MQVFKLYVFRLFTLYVVTIQQAWLHAHKSVNEIQYAKDYLLSQEPSTGFKRLEAFLNWITSSAKEQTHSLPD